jgi:hypothetical protein
LPARIGQIGTLQQELEDPSDYVLCIWQNTLAGGEHETIILSIGARS